MSLSSRLKLLSIFAINSLLLYLCFIFSFDLIVYWHDYSFVYVHINTFMYTYTFKYSSHPSTPFVVLLHWRKKFLTRDWNSLYQKKKFLSRSIIFSCSDSFFLINEIQSFFHDRVVFCSVGLSTACQHYQGMIIIDYYFHSSLYVDGGYLGGPVTITYLKKII